MASILFLCRPSASPRLRHAGAETVAAKVTPAPARTRASDCNRLGFSNGEVLQTPPVGGPSIHVLEADAEVVPAGDDREQRRRPQRGEADRVRHVGFEFAQHHRPFG